jgi:deoxycytidine triphosphate deaminase
MPTPPSFDETLGNCTGFLTDRSIHAALKAEFLIEPGTWEQSQIRHASYTIRLGDRVEVERNSGGGREREHIVLTLTKGGTPLELNPGDTAKLYSLENLRLPASILGFTVARGLLFVECLVPENTYVDPGYSGQIYTTVTNLSGRVLKIPYGAPIARLFFYRLSEIVSQPYRSGPAIGIAQHLDSVSGVAFPTVDDARRAKAAALYADLRASERGGTRTGELLRRNAAMGRAALLTAIVWPIALQVGLSRDWLGSNTNAFWLGVVSSIVASVLIIVTERVWRRISEAG